MIRALISSVLMLSACSSRPEVGEQFSAGMVTDLAKERVSDVLWELEDQRVINGFVFDQLYEPEDREIIEDAHFAHEIIIELRSDKAYDIDYIMNVLKQQFDTTLYRPE